ncbi:MAG: aspartate dehydrogenase [Pseudomonadota bacterium]
MHLGIIGFGSIGRELTALLAGDPIASLTVLVRPGRAREAEARLAECAPAKACAVVSAAPTLLSAAPQLLVECAGRAALVAIGEPALKAGIDLVAASVGALTDDALRARLTSAAKAGGSQLLLPAGAVGGIDLLASLAPFGGLEVRYKGSKPPRAWAGTPAEAQLDLDRLVEPTVIFRGSAREAARRFPKNANVAATIGLAGAGLDATAVTLMADPESRRNRHWFRAESPLGAFEIDIENAPSPGNARTSMATVLSLYRVIYNRQAAVVL